MLSLDSISKGKMEQLTPKVHSYLDNATGKIVDGYVPEFLEKGKTYRVARERQTEWGTLVKTDRLSVWINKDWFREV